MKKFVFDVPSSKTLSGVLSDNIKLADPEYNIAEGVDLLLSNQFVFDIICKGKPQVLRQKQSYKKQKLDCVVCSLKKIYIQPENNIVAVNTICERLLDNFWKLGEVPMNK